MKVTIQVIDDRGKVYSGKLTLDATKNISQKTKEISILKKRSKTIRPSDIIRNELYISNFFKTHKTFTSVEKKLNDSGYHFKKGSILMALKGAKYLTKIGKKGSYKFVQKHPPQA